MSIEDTHKWAKEKMSQWPDLAKEPCPWDGTTKGMMAARELKFSNDSFFGDVTSRDGDLFFHFFPTANSSFNLCTENGEPVWVFNSEFVNDLTEAFLEVFKFADRIFLDFVLELQSYVVRCAGYGENPFQDEMIDKVLLGIKERYER